VAFCGGGRCWWRWTTASATARRSSSGAALYEVSWGGIGLSYGTGCSEMYFLGCDIVAKQGVP